MNKPSAEAASKADFSRIRYAQVWEDADVLMEALNIRPGSVCLSISSAGDNTLAMLIHNPHKVYALDLNPAQLHCLALRVAAFRCLDHPRLLELIGATPSSQRLQWYTLCREALDEQARSFWDERQHLITNGIGAIGKFEHYFSLFRRRVLPFIHRQGAVQALLEERDITARRQFYHDRWNNWRWQWLFRIFFSRTMMGRLGRAPAFFQYVEGRVADRILQRTRYALTELDPSANPYLHWILRGQYGKTLPLYLREEHFHAIRKNLDCLEWRLASVEDFVADLSEPILDACNLSDIFEYMSEENTENLLRHISRACRSGARLAYWNMLVPRSRPASLADQLSPLNEISEQLFLKDKAFFYSRFIVEEKK